MTSESEGRDRSRGQSKFNRVEWLASVVVAVALVGCAGPALQQAQKKAQQNKAMQQAVGIGRALNVYASEEDGLYPTGDDANRAFANLFPDMGRERPFYVSGSAWHGQPGSRFANGPDELFGDDDGGKPLEPGENHWAFNILASDDSAADIPMIADGFSARLGRYSSDPSEFGGVWGGRNAIVVFADRSARIVPLNRQMQFINIKKNNRDEFNRHGVEMVNPAHPGT